MTTASPPKVDLEALRSAIQDEYEIVAREPERGFHFHTGRPLARLLAYDDAWLEGVPEESIVSFAAPETRSASGRSSRASGSSTSAAGAASTA